MQIRKPIVDGQFYPSERQSCLDEINDCLEARPITVDLPESIVGGIVPHAGWVFSGSLATMVFAAVKKQTEEIDTFVIFGASHSYFGSKPALDDNDKWQSPLGTIYVDKELAQFVLENSQVIQDNSAHAGEHSIEVQVPFIQHLFPKAAILPIIVPPNETSIALGEVFIDAINQFNKKIILIGSTDLTHYGPRYGFTPMGAGDTGLRWAGNINDQQFIELALSLKPRQLLQNSIESANSCGPGAATAVVAAAKKLGKTEGILLAKTDSNRVMIQKMGSKSRDSVGYAAMVF